ncbi:MAG TPA: hypothetical protein VHN11_07980 [Xanthobacteraceae bacterium]|jgi:hypothetical protein|nr:hypothetical protein [Xanthobacteraceae bacterium]
MMPTDTSQFTVSPSAYTGGAQPYAPPGHLTAPSVDVISFDPRREQLMAEAAMLSQPDPWVFFEAGSLGPYAPRKLAPSLTVPRIDNPPAASNKASLIENLMLSQPETWPFVFSGGLQPYAQFREAPGIPGQSIGPTPIDRRKYQIAQELATITQADPWVYVFEGSTQPYTAAKLHVSITGAPVNPPPPAFKGPAALVLELATISQPDPWVYEFAGGWQPYTPSKLAVTTLPSNPIFGLRGLQVMAGAIAANQPDPWAYEFTGTAQFYGAIRAPGIPGQSLDRPPAGLQRERLSAIEASLASQPDPWAYVIPGSFGAYAALKLNPIIIANQQDAPPPAFKGYYALVSEFAAVNQPDPWSYAFSGTAQPYAPARLNPSITAVQVDTPPFELGGPYVEITAGAQFAQPDAWIYAFAGAQQPHSPKLLNPAITSVPVDSPPSTDGGPAIFTTFSALAAQPDPWTYSFNGAQQPYSAKILNASLAAVPEDTVLFSASGFMPVVTQAWSLSDLPQQPYKMRITVRLALGRGYIIS